MSAIIQGKGDVFGPVAATDGDLAVYNGTSGKILKSVTLLPYANMPVGTVIQFLTVKSVGVIGPISSAAFDFLQIPTASNGTEVFNLAITPKFSNSLIEIEFHANVSASAADWMSGWIMRSGVTNALNGSVVYGVSTAMVPLIVYHTDPAGSTAVRTYAARVARGSSPNSGMYLNGISGMGGIFGNTAVTTMILREIRQ